MRVRATRGFTVVELVIVLIAIAVLALIVMNSLAVAQRQGRNAQTISAVKAYQKALVEYASDHDDYPHPVASGTGVSCLGSDYGDYNGDGSAGDCWHIYSDSATKPSSYFGDQIKSYLNNSLPMPSTHLLRSNDGQDFLHTGATYTYQTDLSVDGQPAYWLLSYTIEGDQATCPVGLALAAQSANAYSTHNPQGYTERYGTEGVGCVIALPNPTGSN